MEELTINGEEYPRANIERIQKSAMKVIFGREYQGYEKSLKLLKMECLNERREKASLKVAKKSLQQEKLPADFCCSVQDLHI